MIELRAKPVIDQMFKNWETKPNTKLIIITNSKDFASGVYVRNKKKMCEEHGITCERVDSSNMEFGGVLRVINGALVNNSYILLQKPLAPQLKTFESALDYKIEECISLDVDAFSGDLSNDFQTPCTPLGIMKMLEYYNIGVDSMNAVVIGRSKIVGKPMADLLLKSNATVTVCHSHTKDLSFYTKHADIIVSAVGKADFIKADMIKNGAIIIDVGINRNEAGKVQGDCKVDEEFLSKVSAYTPVPGGVGPMTVATLVWKMGLNKSL